ncbi:MAG: glycine cleavage system protein GcvH [Desulfovibrio sp.]|jgi:glycine cleavage system H protein|nr:glycine cleavage system protein GcvH [Desulfovibrio sp.]
MKTAAELNLPGDRRYTGEHVWIMPDGDSWLVGISDYAQDQLGEVAYVDLPSEGNALKGHDEFGSIESIKTVNALFMPVDGEIIEVNANLEDAPETVNADCYGAGWLARIKPANAADVDKLMDAEAYRASLG